MSNISAQLIKDSYNYVLQSDIITGVVYRIGGAVAVNPQFISGLTVNSSFTYSDGSEFPGYVLTCDALGNAIWGPVSAATSGIFVTGGTFDYSGGTLELRNSNGTAATIPGLQDVYVTGGTLSGTSVIFTYNDGNNFELVGITPFDVFTAYTASTEIILSNKVDVSTFNQFAQDTNIALNNKLEISNFTAYTATTQPLILNAVTGGTYSSGTLSLKNNSGGTVTITGFSQTTDSFVTGFSYNNYQLVLTQNRLDSYSSFTVTLSGFVQNDSFTSYTASTNTKIQNSITGGTYSGGTLYLVNNSGTTIPITGFTTGSSQTTDTFVTGFSYNNYQLVLTQNRLDGYSSFTVNLTGFVQTDTFTSYTASTNTKIENSVTGGTYSGGTLYLINNSGATIQITGFSTSSSGGSSNLQYYISASTPTGTINSGDRWFNTQTGIELVYINDGDSSQWVQPFSVPGPAGQDLGVHSTTGITTSQILTWDKTYLGISASTLVNLTLPTTVGKDGYYLIIKDESGLCGNYRIRLTPSFGLIDGNNFVDMNINYMSLTCMVRNGNWYLI